MQHSSNVMTDRNPAKYYLSKTMLQNRVQEIPSPMMFSLQSSVLVVLFLSKRCKKSDKGKLHADTNEYNIICRQTTVSDKICPVTLQILIH